MKRLILGVTIAALTIGPAMAGRHVELKTQDDNADYEYVHVTGSNIPQRIKKRNIIILGTDAPLLAIDQREMARNGNAQLADQLRHYPGVQITGH